MCRKLIYLISFIVALSLASNVSASLVGHWSFDEGAGATAADSSGYGNDGTLSGNADWVEGYLGGAVSLDGASWIDVPPAAWDTIERKVTVAFWAFGGDAMPVDHFVLPPSVPTTIRQGRLRLTFHGVMETCTGTPDTMVVLTIGSTYPCPQNTKKVSGFIGRSPRIAIPAKYTFTSMVKSSIAVRA